MPESLGDFILPVDLAAHVTAAAFLGDAAAFALGDGRVVMLDQDGVRELPAHPDAAILVTASNGDFMLTGGDDGRVVAIHADGSFEAVAEGGQWIDALAIGPGGAIAWSAGRKVVARDGKGWQAGIELPSSGRGLAFAPKGFQLAISRYNGVSLWFPRSSAVPKDLQWKGSHLDVTWSPDARFVVSTMQENTLHGWRVADNSHMRMSGYPAKTRSISWSSDGKWLATSGADAVIVWPFMTRDGPMGKPPMELAVMRSRVERVAFHPHAPVVAVGYRDGAIMLARLDDGGELPARPAGEDGAISALAWDRTGMRLVFGTSEGAGGVLTLPKV